MLFADDIHAQLNTLVTNKDGWAGNKLANLVLAFATERTIKRVLGRIATAGLTHEYSVRLTSASQRFFYLYSLQFKHWQPIGTMFFIHLPKKT
jgi:hypothetical protein